MLPRGTACLGDTRDPTNPPVGFAASISSYSRSVPLKVGKNQNLPRSGVNKHREAAGAASSTGFCSRPQGVNRSFPSGKRRGQRAVPNTPVLPEHRAARRPPCCSPCKCFQLPAPESRRARYTCNYQAKRLRARKTAELVLLPTQHKEALTSTQQPTCAGGRNNYIFILSFRHLLTFLHTAAKGQARTDGSRSEDGQGGRCRAWSKHLPTAPPLGMVLTGHCIPPFACNWGEETFLPGLREIWGWSSPHLCSVRACSSTSLPPERKSSPCQLCSLFSSQQSFPSSLPPHVLSPATGLGTGNFCLLSVTRAAGSTRCLGVLGAAWTKAATQNCRTG